MKSFVLLFLFSFLFWKQATCWNPQNKYATFFTLERFVMRSDEHGGGIGSDLECNDEALLIERLKLYYETCIPASLFFNFSVTTINMYQNSAWGHENNFTMDEIYTKLAMGYTSGVIELTEIYTTQECEENSEFLIFASRGFSFHTGICYGKVYSENGAAYSGESFRLFHSYVYDPLIYVTLLENIVGFVVFGATLDAIFVIICVIVVVSYVVQVCVRKNKMGNVVRVVEEEKDADKKEKELENMNDGKLKNVSPRKETEKTFVSTKQRIKWYCVLLRITKSVFILLWNEVNDLWIMWFMLAEFLNNPPIEEPEYNYLRTVHGFIQWSTLVLLCSILLFDLILLSYWIRFNIVSPTQTIILIGAYKEWLVVRLFKSFVFLNFIAFGCFSYLGTINLADYDPLKEIPTLETLGFFIALVLIVCKIISILAYNGSSSNNYMVKVRTMKLREVYRFPELFISFGSIFRNHDEILDHAIMALSLVEKSEGIAALQKSSNFCHLDFGYIQSLSNESIHVLKDLFWGLKLEEKESVKDVILFKSPLTNSWIKTIFGCRHGCPKKKI